MSDRRFQTPSQVTLEDLLRLKRVERPPPEFWEGFEQELREKQLAALVERRSWWHGLAAAFSRFGWLRVPLGATAVLAITLVSVRYYSSSTRDDGGQPSALAEDRAAVVAMARAMPAEPKPLEQVHVVMSPDTAVSRDRTTTEGPDTSLMASDSVRTTPQQTAEPVQQVAVSDDATGSSGVEPFAGSVGIQFESVGGVAPALVAAVARPIGFEERSISTPRLHRAAEMLPTAVAMTEQHRSRLLAALGSTGSYAPEPSAPEHVKRSVIRYLAEDGWDRSMSRLQAEADHLSFRF